MTDCEPCAVREGTREPAYAYARARNGIWANVCHWHFNKWQCSLGEDCGELLEEV